MLCVFFFKPYFHRNRLLTDTRSSLSAIFYFAERTQCRRRVVLLLFWPRFSSAHFFIIYFPFFNKTLEILANNVSIFCRTCNFLINKKNTVAVMKTSVYVLIYVVWFIMCNSNTSIFVFYLPLLLVKSPFLYRDLCRSVLFHHARNILPSSTFVCWGKKCIRHGWFRISEVFLVTESV